MFAVGDARGHECGAWRRHPSTLNGFKGEKICITFSTFQ